MSAKLKIIENYSSDMSGGEPKEHYDDNYFIMENSSHGQSDDPEISEDDDNPNPYLDHSLA